jgi:hypothetical protein
MSKAPGYQRGVLRCKQLWADAIKLGTTALSFTAAQFNQIMAAFGTVSFDRGVKIARVALTALDTGGGVLAWANPEAGSIIIHRIVFDVTTKSTSASTVDVGTTATNATTSSNNLLTGVDFGSAAGVFDNITNKGASGVSVQKLATGKWVTASKASGACAGLVGFAYIYYNNI